MTQLPPGQVELAAGDDPASLTEDDESWLVRRCWCGADWQSAGSQVANLRYDRLPVCAT